MNRNLFLLLLSSSTLHGSRYLEWASKYIKEFLNAKQVKNVLFIPYALRDMDSYADKAMEAFNSMGFQMSSIHTQQNPIEAVEKAEALFIGGGNTFQLLKSLYDNKLMDVIRTRVLEEGVPYIGSSAGTNVATINICTTNDMPIVYPPSFSGLKLVPFNINPHFIEADANSTHMGETREERIKQYLELPKTPSVLALKEGSFLEVKGGKAVIKGKFAAKLFERGNEVRDLPTESDVSFLLKEDN